jgi:hypothetical protein
MSYGTAIFPKIEDFTKYSDLSVEELRAHRDSEIRLMTNAFVELMALSLCTPFDLFGDKAYEKIKQAVSDCFCDYVESFQINFDLNNLLDLKDQGPTITKEGDLEKVPYLYFNHYIYHSKEEAESAIEDSRNKLLEIQGKILGICLATPIDITPRDQTQYVDGHYEPLTYLEQEMDYLEESLEDCLHTMCVARMVAKYWDGHKEG